MKRGHDTASGAKKELPIVIKKVVGYKGGHASDAWKLAYADFITAMMAFFLLLWLLNSVPSQKLKNMALYFEPTLGVLGKSGINEKDVKSQEKEDVASKGPNVKGFVYGVAQTGKMVSVPSEGQPVDEKVESEQFSLFESSLEKELNRDEVLQKFRESIQVEQSPEGLLIQITDQDNLPLFKAGTAVLMDYTKNLLAKITDLIKYFPNFIAISGYTDKSQDSTLADYGKWELSSDRANAARRFMISTGIAPEKIAKISAYADTQPLISGNPYDPKNRRVSVLLLRKSQMPIYKLSATKDLLSFDNANGAGKKEE
ncbi:chemotaxis protein MotB [Alphaproteobacteria bacterium]